MAAAVVYAGGPAHAAELIDGYLAAGPVRRDELEAALPVLLRLRWAVQADRAARRGAAEPLRRAREALESAAGMTMGEDGQPEVFSPFVGGGGEVGWGLPLLLRL